MKKQSDQIPRPFCGNRIRESCTRGFIVRIHGFISYHGPDSKKVQSVSPKMLDSHRFRRIQSTNPVILILPFSHETTTNRLSLNLHICFQEEEQPVCCICLVNRPGSFCFEPCRHAVCCSRCAQQIQAHNRTCPMCRQKIEKIFTFFH
jgi:hypothetical protein